MPDNDKRERSAFGSGGKQDWFNHSPTNIFNTPEITASRDVIVLFRDANNQPQMRTTGDRAQAEKLVTDAYDLLGIQENVG